MELKRSRYLIFRVFLLLGLTVLSLGMRAQNSLSGKVIDKETGELLIGVVIYLPDLKTAAVTDINGNYSLGNLPNKKVLVQVKLLGYQTQIESVDLTSVTTRDFELLSAVKEIHEVVITGTSKATEIERNPIPIISIDLKKLDEELNTNLIEAIAKEPGVSAVTTGPNVSKPFIHGLGYNRILTLYDGIRQEGQQWGDEHGIEVDEYGIGKIEVIKGPASLMYGSDALAGVVNLLPANPVPDGRVEGGFLTNYQSNNGLIGSSFNIDGNRKGLIWGGRVSYKQAMDYTNRVDGRVYGTAFKETNADGYVGLNKSWGFSHLRFSVYTSLQEIPDGSRDSLTRKFTKQISEADTVRPIVSNGELNTYKINVLHQSIQHYRIVSSNSIYLGDYKLSTQVAFQQNRRREYSHPLNPDIAGLSLVLNTVTYNVALHFPEVKGVETSVGINGMLQKNQSSGTEFIIPDYFQVDIGPFIVLKKAVKNFDFLTGIRYDTRLFSNDAMYVKKDPTTGFDMQTSAGDATAGVSEPFTNYKHSFSGYSGSLGFSWAITKRILLKANIAQGYRAPNIAEISANGEHPGTNIYQIGNQNLNPEISVQEDLGINYTTNHVQLFVEVFNNNIENYIYNARILNRFGKDSVVIANSETFKYNQTNARLYGAEIGFDIHPHPLDWLHIENSASILYAENLGIKGHPIEAGTKYLPMIPPFHTSSELRANISKKFRNFASLYVKVEVEYYASQKDVFSAYGTETPTAGYTLYNAGIGGNLTNKGGKVILSFSILGNNISDIAYQSHLSRLKYFEPYPNNGSGYSGIYNMGRNISIKIRMPLSFFEKK